MSGEAYLGISHTWREYQCDSLFGHLYLETLRGDREELSQLRLRVERVQSLVSA